jgi:heme/copper-type cytochrome/quinol oxidase subunit 2
MTVPVPFSQHPFTSTLSHDINLPSFNYYLVIMTALVFFTVLAWFNFVLALYNTIINTDAEIKDNTLINLGFAVLWTFIVVYIYFVMDYFEVLGYNKNVSVDDGLRDDTITTNTSPSFTDGTTEYVGEFNIAAI